MEKNDRVELVSTNDQFTRLVPGDRGTIHGIHDDGFGIVILVDWDSGSSMSLIQGTDQFTVLPPANSDHC